MIDHFTLKVSDYPRSKAFYTRALRPLGYGLVMEFGSICGMGEKGKPDLWLSLDPANARPGHFAFQTTDRKLVDAFYAAALQAGGKDNGPPGVRADYHPSYYGAFVLDPDGHNVEAVCHVPPRAGRKAAPARARKAATKAAKEAARPAARKKTASKRR